MMPAYQNPWVFSLSGLLHARCQSRVSIENRGNPNESIRELYLHFSASGRRNANRLTLTQALAPPSPQQAAEPACLRPSEVLSLKRFFCMGIELSAQRGEDCGVNYSAGVSWNIQQVSAGCQSRAESSRFQILATGFTLHS